MQHRVHVRIGEHAEPVAGAEELRRLERAVVVADRVDAVGAQQREQHVAMLAVVESSGADVSLQDDMAPVQEEVAPGDPEFAEAERPDAAVRELPPT